MPPPAQLLTAIRAEQARRSEIAERERVRIRSASLAGFVQEAWHVLEPNQPYVHGWHIEALCAHLEAITHGHFLALGLENRLLINVPPGTMKSLVVSVFWPAWEWGPCGLAGLRYLTTSYKEDFVKRDARRMRDLVSSAWYRALWPHVALSRSGEISFANTATGSREGMPFASLTAGRGDRVIIDDPHSTETAESEPERERTLRIFRESVTTRLNDPGRSAIVVIMQRLHERDVSGEILRLGLGYVHLMLPMEFEPDRACRTPIFADPRTLDGELLFPERFPRAVVERDKVPLGAYAVAGQFQQRPAPREGGLFDRAGFGIVDALPPIEKWVRAWDFAGTKNRPGANPDWTVGVKMGRGADKRFYIADVVRVRETPGKVRQRLINTAGQDGAAVGIRIPKDAGQAGIAQAEDYVTALAGFIVSAVAPTGSKEVRAKPLSSQIEVGNVLLLRGSWNDAFLEELGMFPAGSHDDQVDAAADAFNELAGVLPGEGLIEFYRRQQEQLLKVGGQQIEQSTPASTIEREVLLIIPPESGTVVGLSGATYQPDRNGQIRASAKDAKYLRAIGFRDVIL
ncbi:phage terminase large subunit [Methylobacterium radiotolerans]|uniref:phage terminase large subunit n=1 Tax=Methylobacterium radiotolerans TaxID=31998 RepID=UPI001FCECB49|nr:phage terminase large subunit [Methylobacterium radiotolerans]